jgi:rhomboid-like protein
MRRSPLIFILIAINVGVFLLWHSSASGEPQFMIDNFLVSWNALLAGRIWTLLTAVFSHQGLLHLFLNLYVLASFGPIVARVLGPWRFLRFYLTAGIISSLSHALISAFILNQPDLPALGASGAISGIILLFSFVFPREKILIFGLIPMPAIFGALVFVGLDLWGLVAQAEGGGLPIGHGAHLGGALTGALYFLIVVRLRLVRRAS